jgi:hypothetical protein
MSRKRKSKAHWQAMADVPDYGEFTGVGSSNLPTCYNRLVVRVSPGWRTSPAALGSCGSPMSTAKTQRHSFAS